LLVFPQALQQLKDVLKIDTALVIKGRVRHEENATTKVVVSEAKPLEAVNGAKPSLLIRMNAANCGEDLLDDLESVLTANPGENPVVFEVTRSSDFRARLRPRRAKSVKASDEIVRRLREICGEEAVSLEKV